MIWQPAYVGVGSNLDAPEQQVRRALAALAELPESRLVAQSSLYGSKPWGYAEQPDFVNAVAGLLTRLPVEAFFERLRELEQALGRTAPTVRWGPRRIDLDLLLFGRTQCASPQLTLPHPELTRRNFVLCPLAELAPELVVEGERAGELAERLDRTGLWLLDQRVPSA